ncbi:hypothetical protein GGQ84_002647 [Desulfitispora alkaliphila]|uniref:copper amine oxidase N-terminal domain-containing protein n=1 Tax=Desulfitispora alkaliphila TaxID=622674 RepID=UPI003D1B96B1
MTSLPGYKNDKGIIIYIKGDGLSDLQANIVWGKSLAELDRETKENVVTYKLTELNENKTLVITATSIDELKKVVTTDVALQDLITEIKRVKNVKPQTNIIMPTSDITADQYQKQNQQSKQDNLVNLVINEETVDFDVPAQMLNGRTMVPLRGIFELYGAEVDWDSSTNTIKAVKENTTIILQVNNKEGLVNNKKIELDVPAQIVDGRTLVPLRFISESMGLNVKWDGETGTAFIQSNNE